MRRLMLVGLLALSACSSTPTYCVMPDGKPCPGSSNNNPDGDYAVMLAPVVDVLRLLVH